MHFQTNNLASRFYFFFILLLTTGLLRPAFANTEWQTVSPGIEYQALLAGILTPWAKVHVFRIDLNKNQLELISAKTLGLKDADVSLMGQASHALISLNGGFFDHEFHPLGLRINHKKLENPLKHISWWGIFYIKNNKAHIKAQNHFQYKEDIEFALQSGPRLLINGKSPALKPGKDNRSALGITEDGKIILLISTNAPMSTDELAHLMKSYPLSCKDAINLDGGSSSQLYAHMQDLKLNVHGFSNVSDAIVVRPLAMD